MQIVTSKDNILQHTATPVLTVTNLGPSEFLAQSRSLLPYPFSLPWVSSGWSSAFASYMDAPRQTAGLLGLWGSALFHGNSEFFTQGKRGGTGVLLLSHSENEVVVANLWNFVNCLSWRGQCKQSLQWADERHCFRAKICFNDLFLESNPKTAVRTPK